MEVEGPKGIGGWLLVYIVGSVPLLVVYSMGLSGWFFEYPFALMVIIFVALATPLFLILRKRGAAVRWNVYLLWAALVLMTLRSLSVVLLPSGAWDPMSLEETLQVIPILCLILAVALAWAVVWTAYFRKSVRVRNTLLF